MAYNVYGTVRYKDSTGVCKTARGYVLPYFKKVAASSSNSKWSDTPYGIEPTGYYSFDLNDNQMLKVTGVYDKTKDKIYIAVYWKLGDLLQKSKDGVDITHAAFVDHQMIQGDGAEINIDLWNVRTPVVQTSALPANDILTRTTYTMSEKSITDTTWYAAQCSPAPTVQTSQKLAYDTVPIFDGHQFLPTIYDWDEIATRTKNPSSTELTNTSDTYQFQVAGVYTISMTIREKWNTQVILSKTVTVRYNEPVPNFNWTPTLTNNWNGPKLKGQEEITFNNTSSDIDGRTSTVYTYNWVIEDKNYDGSDNTKTYNNQSLTYKPKHKYQSPGTKKITLTINWNDGFIDKQISVEKTLEIFPFTIVPKFTNVPLVPENRGQDVTFDPSLTTGDTDRIFQYDWVINDHWNPTVARRRAFTVAEPSKWMEGSSNPALSVNNQRLFTDVENPVIRYHSDDDETASVTIHYYNGWVNETNSITNTITKSTYTLNPDFSWTPLVPISRDVEVSFSNDTPDLKALTRNTSWYIQDSYELWNPENPTYGTSVKDNQTNHIMQASTFEPTHKFQSIDDSLVKLTVIFDDGWMEDQLDVEDTVTKTEYTITADLNTSTNNIYNLVGPGTVNFLNTTPDPNSRTLSTGEEWTIEDESGIDSNTYTHHVVLNPKYTNVPYAFKWPSSKPLSAVNGSSAYPDNKSATLVVNYDNGWNDHTYTTKTRIFPVRPYEVDMDILFNCNVDNYTH